MMCAELLVFGKFCLELCYGWNQTETVWKSVEKDVCA